MVKITSFPDDVVFDVNADETLLEAGLRSGVAVAQACGGRAKCSTCRIWVLDGLGDCPQRSADEASMADRLGLADEVVPASILLDVVGPAGPMASPSTGSTGPT